MTSINPRSFALNAVALAMLACFGAAQAQDGTTFDKVTVTGEGDKLGTGLLMQEDAPKARSSVTKAELDKTRSSGNPFQALSLLPGVNSSSYDATGLFGGNLRVRGFNSDQMGFTVNGAPVNDSGNFAVYPQEYIDQEDLCSLYVTQGAPDTDAPHVGASGGNVGIVSCAPENERRTRVAVSGGQLGYYRLYGRVDTGKLGDFKAFVSVSKSEANKWKGLGKADRDHLDTAMEYDLGGGNKLSGSLLYNHALNNNFLALTPAQFAQYGYYKDFSGTVPQHATPVNGSTQDEGSVASPAFPNTAYYGYALNPFDDGLLTAKGSFALSEHLRLDVQPYFWYGYGTGGTQQTSLQESSGANLLKGGIADINGDGDTRDKVLVYRGSLTKTLRPGVTTSLTYVLDNQKINGGFWLERARHRQTQPGTRVDNNGAVTDPWLGGNLINYNDGLSYQGRDWLTISTGSSLFIQDTIELLGTKLQITPALSYRRIQRDFTNYPNSGAGGAAYYQVSNSYSKALPSLALSYQATDRLQLFGNLAENFRVPSNFEYGNLGNGNPTIVNGVASYALPLKDLGVKPESTINFEVGTRYQGDLFRGSVVAFLDKFKNRISSSTNPVSLTTTDTNVGSSTTKGLELELGTVPIRGFSAYASGSYTRSSIDDNVVQHLVGGVLVPYATAGKQFPDTPKGMASLSLQYAQGPYLLNIAGKYTGSRFLTLVNDVQVKSYTTVDLNAAWKLPNPSGTGFKNPVLRLNVSNLFGKQYFLANSGSGSNVTPDASGNPVVYAGAPRFASMSFQVDY